MDDERLLSDFHNPPPQSIIILKLPSKRKTITKAKKPKTTMEDEDGKAGPSGTTTESSSKSDEGISANVKVKYARDEEEEEHDADAEVEKVGDSAGDTGNETSTSSPDTAGSHAHAVYWIPTLLALLRKNILLLGNSPIQLFFILLLPSSIVAIAKGIEGLASNANQWEDYYDLSDENGNALRRPLEDGSVPIKPCEWYDVYNKQATNDCVTILFALFDGATPDDVEAVHRIMETVATEADLTFGTSQDSPERFTSANDVHGLPSAKEIGDFMVAHPGRASTIVYFRSSIIMADAAAAATSPSTLVDVRFNNTSSNYYWASSFQPATNEKLVPKAIQRAIRESSQSKSVNVKISVSAFSAQDIGTEDDDEQQSVNNFDDDFYDDWGAETVAIFFPILMSFALVGSAAILGNHVANEKQLFLVGSLRVVGMADSAYWCSWMLVQLLVQLTSSLLAMALAYIMDLPVVTEGAFLAPFLALFANGLLMFAAIMTIVSIAQGRPLLYGLQFVLLLTSIVGSSMSISFTASPTDKAGRIFQAFVPGYNLGKVTKSILDYNNRAQGVEDANLTSYEIGTMFKRLGRCNYEALRENATCIIEPKYDDWRSTCWQFSDCGIGGAATDEYCAPDTCYYYPTSDFVSILIILTQAAVFVLLAWYLFQIIPSGNGLVYKPWFIVDYKYWKKSSPQSTEGDQLKSLEEESILLRSITKTFRKGAVVAVNSVDLDITKGQVYVMLGHNGAGKTTLINMMTGKLSPSSGNAYIMGKSVRQDLHSLQKLVGSVPQHDLLWSGMSAYEHIRMFAKIKGISRSPQELDDQVHSILKKVHLDGSSSQAAGDYSGGMKRRLSIALAGIGDPKVLFMDEPTTGIDPLNRRRIWSLVRELKKDRIIVLTTHLMQEADVLGDNIAILDNGMIQAQGTPLNLKTEHGTGYTLNIVTDMVNLERVTDMVKSKIPSVQIVSSAAGSLAIGVPRDSLGSVPDLTRQLQEQELIREWSISQSTLEEVFLHLAQSSTSLQNRHDQVASPTAVQASRPEQGLEDAAVGSGEDAGDPELGDDGVENVAPTVFATGPALWWLQLSALLRKSLVLKRRSWIASLVQLGIPIALMALLYWLKPSPLDPDSDPDSSQVLVWPQAVAWIDTVRVSYSGDFGRDTPQCSFEWLVSSSFASNRDPLKTLKTSEGAAHSVLYPEAESAPNLHFDVAASGSSISAVQDALVVGMEFLLSRASTVEDQGFADAVCAENPYACGPCSVKFLAWEATELEGGIMQFRISGLPGEQNLQRCSTYGGICSVSIMEYLLSNEQVLSSAGDYLGSPVSLTGSFGYSQDSSLQFDHIRRAGVEDAGKEAGQYEVYRAGCYECREERAQLWVSGSGADMFAGAVSSVIDNIVATISTEDIVDSVQINRRILEEMSTTFTEHESFDYSACANIGRTEYEAEYFLGTNQDAGYIVNAENPTATVDDLFFNEEYYYSGNGAVCRVPLGSVQGYHDLFPDAGVSISLSKTDESSDIDVNWVLYDYDRRAPYRLHYQSVYAVHCASQDANFTTGECFPGVELRCTRTQPQEACEGSGRYSFSYNYDDDMILKATYSILASAGEIGALPILRDVQAPIEVEYIPAVELSDIEILCFVIGLSLAILVPSTASTLVMEKHQRYVFTLILNGLELRNYWLSAYLFHAASALLISLILIILGPAFQLGAFVSQDINYFHLIVVLVTYIHAQFCFLALLSNVFRRERFAAVLLGFLVFSAFGAAFIVHNVATGIVNDWPGALSLIPMLGCFRALVLVFWDRYTPELWRSVGIVLGSSTVYLWLGMYWHGATGIGSIYKLGCTSKKANDVDEEEDEVDGVEHDVANEQKRALAISPQDTAVKIVHLGKTFPARPTPKHAVVDVSMAMDYGDIFGLLGPNGCGKTTTISMLVGQITPSRGAAYVAGFDAVAQRKEAIRKLGIVPQFDVVYPDLTVQEHLEMFAAMKGVARTSQTPWANRNAKSVGLGGDLFERQAKALSGGMRRRLSIAIALLSDPKVLFLDEPTTGLDPDMKRAIWNIIERMRQDRCIILTTHAMDEAEALCSRIGIMTQGSLKCVGTQTELRGRYGSTYELTFTLPTTPESNNEVVLTAFLRKQSESAKLISSHSQTRVYTMDKEGMDLATLFEMVIQGQKDGIYTEWGINNTSLDEVFVAITAESEGVDSTELL